MAANVSRSGENRKLGPLAKKLLIGGGVAGLAALGLSFALGMGDQDAFFHSYLLAWLFFLSISLGALFFVLIHHVTQAGWSVVIRRLAEALALNVVVMLVLSLPLVFLGLDNLYEWVRFQDTQHEAHAAEAEASGGEAHATEGDHGESGVEHHETMLLEWKKPYLNTGFFLLRWLIIFGIWILYASFYFRKSVEQDRTADLRLSVRMRFWAGVGIVIYAFTMNFFSFDWMMSLDPYWFSTMFGVYWFSGSLVAFFATIPLVSYLLQRSGRLTRSVNQEHYHDMGKYLFAFIVFWAYIAFSQFMLIWYGNLPEETGWFVIRMSGAWGYVGVFLIIGHFALPFLALISRAPKRRYAFLVGAAVWMLFAHWIDLLWITRATWSPGALSLSIYDLTCFIGVGGLFIAGFAFWLREASLLPENDPRLEESLGFKNF